MQLLGRHRIILLLTNDQLISGEIHITRDIQVLELAEEEGLGLTGLVAVGGEGVETHLVGCGGRGRGGVVADLGDELVGTRLRERYSFLGFMVGDNYYNRGKMMGSSDV